MYDVAQNRGKNVFPQTSDQQNHIFHLHNLTANQEHDAKRHIPEGQNNRIIIHDGTWQWWSVTKYNYFVTVLKYIFQVSVLYWSSFILSNFYFYFTTFQSIRSYFLLHYIS